LGLVPADAGPGLQFQDPSVDLQGLARVEAAAFAAVITEEERSAGIPRTSSTRTWSGPPTTRRCCTGSPVSRTSTGGDGPRGTSLPRGAVDHHHDQHDGRHRRHPDREQRRVGLLPPASSPRPPPRRRPPAAHRSPPERSHGIG
jgi:hypothetical protein